MPYGPIMPVVRLVLVGSLGLVLGCGAQERGQAPVHGSVKLDGQPLAQGNILFVPIEGNDGLTLGGTIQDGTYELSGDASPSPGWNRVEIRSLRKSGRKVPKPLAPPGEMVEHEEEAIAEQYNANSTLRVELKANQDNEHSFDVQSRSR